MGEETLAMAFNRIHLIRQVDLFSLKLFLSAIEEQQIGRAAIRENISASTATKRIQDLEEIADVKLFERTPAGVQPTPAGEVLERYVRRIFNDLESLRNEITEFTDGMRGELKVASARSILAPFLAKEFGDFQSQFPEVQLHYAELENAKIIQSVLSGEADVGVFAAASGLDTSGVEVMSYREDWMVAVVPLRHPLASAQSIRFKDLLAENLIPVRAMMGVFNSAATKLKMEFKPTNVVNSAGVAISLAQAGLGVTVTPACLIGRALDGEVAVLELNEPWALRQILVAVSKDRTLGKPAAAFVEQLLDQPGKLGTGT